jgi:hypothetical protein
MQTTVAGLVLPGVACAALALKINGPTTGGLNGADALPIPGRQAFDLVFTETPPTENEFLRAYDLSLVVPQAVPRC